MEKRTVYRLDWRRNRSDYFCIYHLAFPAPCWIMIEKDNHFINLHSTVYHDEKADPTFYPARR